MLKEFREVYNGDTLLTRNFSVFEEYYGEVRFVKNFLMFDRNKTPVVPHYEFDVIFSCNDWDVLEKIPFDKTLIEKEDVIKDSKFRYHALSVSASEDLVGLSSDDIFSKLEEYLNEYIIIPIDDYSDFD